MNRSEGCTCSNYHMWLLSVQLAVNKHYKHTNYTQHKQLNTIYHQQKRMLSTVYCSVTIVSCSNVSRYCSAPELYLVNIE